LLVANVDAVPSSDRFIETIDGQTVEAGSPAMLAKLENLARKDHISLLQWCLQNYDKTVTDYSCTLIKQERLNGRLLPEQQIKVKYVDSPFSVAMTWVKNPGKADRAIYVEGKYDGNMLIRPAASWLRMIRPQVRRLPNGKDAQKATLRSIDMFGFRNGLVNLLKIYSLADKAGELAMEFGGYSTVAGKKCIVIVRHLPATDPAYPNKITEIHIDIERLLPICVKGIGWDDELLCNYIYKDLRFNVGLGAKDFLPENNGM